jgi:hypothetical protein
VIDGSGRATAAWEQSDGATIRTVTRDFVSSGAAPVMTVGSAPSFVTEAAPGACRPAGARVLRASTQATIFISGGYLACLLARGKPVPLTTADEESNQPSGSMALAGPFVAYAVDFLGHSSHFSTMAVTDLRDPDGGINRSAPLDRTDVGFLVESRLKPNGAVAWITCPVLEKPGESRRRCQHAGAMTKHVFAWDRYALKPRLLDSGRTIDPTRFRLRGSKLTWRHGNKLRHARLR